LLRFAFGTGARHSGHERRGSLSRSFQQSTQRKWPRWLSRANYMHSDAASQGGGWWQGCGAAYHWCTSPGGSW